MEPIDPGRPMWRPFKRAWIFEERYRGKPCSPVCLICMEKPGGIALDEDALCPTCGKLLDWFRSLHADDKGLDLSKLNAQTRFLDLYVDSLDYVCWVTEAEEQFDLVIPDAVAEKLMTVGDFLGYIRAHVGGKPPGGSLSMSSPDSDVMWDRQVDG